MRAATTVPAHWALTAADSSPHVHDHDQDHDQANVSTKNARTRIRRSTLSRTELIREPGLENTACSRESIVTGQ